MRRVDDELPEEGAAAENYDLPRHLPGYVKLSRPGMGRGTVVSIRLSAEEHAELQQAAEAAGLPVSTLIRMWALDRMRAERDSTAGTVAERLARPERAVFQRTA